MATSLRSEDCSSVSEADSIFQSEKGLLVLRPNSNDGCCLCGLYFTIPSGCYALVTRHGADENYPVDGSDSAVWPAGLHYWYPPWVGVSHLVTKQSVVLDLPVKGCKTKDNVTVQIDVAIVFRIMGDVEKGEDPELVRRFVHQVTPRGLEQQLRDAQEESVRSLARSLKHTEVYGVRTGSIHDPNILKSNHNNNDDDDDEDEYRDEVLHGIYDTNDKVKAGKAVEKGEDITEVMVQSLNKQFMPQGVQIESVAIKDVRLPQDIMNQMFEKTMVISQNAQQTMYHENQMQLTRMNEEVQTMLQTFQEEKDAELAAGAKTVNAEQVKLDDTKAEATKVEANIREETSVKIQNIRAESNLEVQRVKDSMNAALTKIDTEARKEAAELEANTNLEVQTMMAIADLKRAKNMAKSQEAMASAEGKVAPWIQKKKDFETKQKMLEVFEELASNPDIIISNGSADDGINVVAVADSILQSLPDQQEDERQHSALIAELALLHHGSAPFLKTNLRTE